LIGDVEHDPLQTQIVYAKPPDDGALPDPAGTFNVVHTPFDTEATSLEAGEILVENQYLSIRTIASVSTTRRSRAPSSR
jgi:hypothetical protein